MNDLNVDNKLLIQKMKEMREDPIELVKHEFLAAVMDANYIVPATINPEPLDGKILPNSEIAFFYITNEEKENYILAFSAPEQYVFWKENRKDEGKDNGKNITVLNYGYKQLSQVVMDYPKLFSGFLIDPNGYNFAIEADLIRDIYNSNNPSLKITPQKIMPKDGTSLEPLPVEGYEKLVESISEFLASENSVKAGYLMQTIRKGEDKPTIIVVVDFVGGRMKHIFEGVALAAKDTVEGHDTIGLMPASDRIAGHAVEDVEPFYKKKK